ncbi:MAG TPA: tetratricopeptide repeat protein [Kofleriaceae bacterium]|nr:tetratricopeptide repeat protein [Kofleriaceae bacterium]
MRALAAILAAGVFAAPLSVHADPAVPAKARELAAKGKEAHQKGDYARAIAAFKEAYVIAPSPALLFNLAQAYRLQGNCDDAVLMYQRYLASGPDAEGRELAEGHLATVQRCVQKRNLNIPMDESMQYLSMPTPPKDLGIVDKPVDSPRDPSTSGRLKKDIGIGVGVGGLAALAVAGYYGYRAYDASNEVEDLYASGAKWKQIQPIDERGKSAATTAKIFGVGGGAALATGITLYVLGKRTERLAPIAVTPTAKGAQVGMAWRF